MDKLKKTVSLILVLILMFYSIIAIFTNNSVKAGERTEDLDRLKNYPEIYTAIQELKTAHPNWTFTILYTGLDWNTVLTNETTEAHNRNVVAISYTSDKVDDWVCPICKNNEGKPNVFEGQWYCVSNKTASYYIDPRNWLNDKYIFAFETLSFNGRAHTEAGVRQMLVGTFMDADNITYIDTNGKTQVINKSYAQVICEAGRQYNVSPYHIVARIIQEQGSKGSSTASGSYTYTDANGNVTQYNGYYNYFNIGATAPKGAPISETIKAGLESAKEKGWTNPELSIIGGTSFLAREYLSGRQDTLYLQKFNVDNAVYWHQYQQNISAPYTESLNVKSAYNDIGILEGNFNFVIPVYENMPSTASVKPGISLSVVTEDVVVSTQSTSLAIRSGASTSYSERARAPKGTILVRIEKAMEVSKDGRYWDKVAYDTGSEMIIGFASREYLADIETRETVNETATISTMCNLRSGPETSNTLVKQILTEGTQITIIDKLSYKVNGHIWYRVRLSDGTQGYVSSAYIKKNETNEPENPINPPITNDKYTIVGNYLKVAPNTKTTDIPELVLQGDIFGTGAKAKVGEQEYTIVMLGDVNGDGEVKSKDYMMIKNYIMKTLQMTEQERLASDVNNDKEIKSKDYMMIKNYIMGTGLINL